MFRIQSNFYYSKYIICCKLYENKTVFLFATTVKSTGGVPNIMRPKKGLANKIPVFCLNIIKLYNNGMEGVDIIGHKTAAYRLDCKGKCNFYLRMFLISKMITCKQSYCLHRNW